MIKESILNFAKQFEYMPEVENSKKLAKAKKFVVVGMGGSHLAADLIRIFEPELDLVVHRNYGLPALSDLRNRLIILSSYSGNTEEVIDAYNTARKMKLKMAVISLGGKLLELAKKNGIPYIQLPEMHLQPRMALGISLMALLKLLNEKDILTKVNALSKTLDPVKFEDEGRVLAEKLKDFIPLIYSSQANRPLAYNWKIQFNENSKIPAFYNTFPELNHNEMEGFDGKNSGSSSPKNFYCIMLRDDADNPRILKRMETLEKLYRARGLKTETIKIEGHDVFQKVFNIIILGDWTAYYSALNHGVDPETVLMVEEFKELMK